MSHVSISEKLLDFSVAHCAVHWQNHEVCPGHPWFTDNTGHHLLIEVSAFAGIWELLSIQKSLSISFYQKPSNAQSLWSVWSLDPFNERTLHQARNQTIKNGDIFTIVSSSQGSSCFVLCSLFSLFCFDFVFSAFPMQSPRLGVQSLLASPIHVC